MAYISFQPNDYFNTKLYTGDGEPTGNAITGVGFQPDWVWTKERSSANSHLLFDAVRGVTKSISSNSTAAQVTDAQYLTAFGTDGFTVGPSNDINEPSSTYASWNWKANGAGSSNTDGSITSTVSASTTSGFSISTYTGTGSNATIGHGLGVKPSMIICKRLNSTGGWISYHSALGATKYLYLDNTDAEATNSTVWQDTEPTTSVFSVGTASNCNASGGTYVAYCFAEKKGFSKFSSHVGNGSTDGVFLYTGFKPAWFLLKPSSGTGQWFIWDSTRSPINQAQKILSPESSIAEADSSGAAVDFLSNGIKIRNSDGGINQSGVTYITMAFASEPLVSSNGVPNTAR